MDRRKISTNILPRLFLSLWRPFTFRDKNQNPEKKYMLKDNYRNTGKRGEICSNLIIKTPEQCHSCRFGLVITDIFHPYSHTYKPLKRRGIHVVCL